MERSTDRILTTHVGSLIRPPAVQEFLRARQRGESYDAAAADAVLRDAVAEVVRQQLDAGVDVVSDGEFGKANSWSTYALERLSGFERRPIPPGESNPFARGEDRARFPDFYRELDGAAGGTSGGNQWDSVAVGPITYTGQAELQRDIDNLRAALDGTDATEAFLPVAAPASVIPDRRNEFYATDEECVQAIADAMHTEYKMIIDAGFILQLDDARAAVTYDRMVPPATLADFQRWVSRHVDALNSALAGLPEDRIRYHVCWGSWPGPHTTDVAFADIVDIVLRVHAGAYVIEGANPRHEHEWKVWQDVKLPAGKIVIPGVVSHATNIVEHPELISDRIVRYAEIVGPEQVIAGTDCGFAQSPFLQRVHPSIQWAKLAALTEGARLATKRLFG
jgi:5-methyltetrahydropteroyltriglutamate--homocysteine methyltransferase